MTLLRNAVLITGVMAVIACGRSSPTAPSIIEPAATATTMIMPAPVSQTLTGTWTSGGQTFTVTQDGTSATGMIAPMTASVGNGITVTESATISGAVAGSSVTLHLDDRIAIDGPDETLKCVAGHTFTGQLSGNTLSGTMNAGTTPLHCDNGEPSVPLPQLDGPVTYTRQ